jgi:hypothetical protein
MTFSKSARFLPLTAVTAIALSFGTVHPASAAEPTATMHHYGLVAFVAADDAPATTQTLTGTVPTTDSTAIATTSSTTAATSVNGQCPAMISAAFGDAGCKISFCESGWNPNVTGSNGEMGWFQINPHYHSDASYDPAQNIAAAYRISAGGTDWSAWSVRSVLTTGICPNGIPYPAS